MGAASPDDFRAEARSDATSAPPFDWTAFTSAGASFVIVSGLMPSLASGAATLAIAPSPDVCPASESIAGTLKSAIGAAFSRPSMLGTAAATFAKSAAGSLVLASPKSAPAAPSACFAVIPTSFATEPTISGLAVWLASGAAGAAGAAAWSAELAGGALVAGGAAGGGCCVDCASARVGTASNETSIRMKASCSIAGLRAAEHGTHSPHELGRGQYHEDDPGRSIGLWC